jgi:hypothetical protein
MLEDMDHQIVFALLCSSNACVTHACFPHAVLVCFTGFTGMLEDMDYQIVFALLCSGHALRMLYSCFTHALLVRITALLRHHSGSIKSLSVLVLDCSRMLEASFAHALPNALRMLFSFFTRALLMLYSCFTRALLQPEPTSPTSCSLAQASTPRPETPLVFII